MGVQKGRKGNCLLLHSVIRKATRIKRQLFNLLKTHFIFSSQFLVSPMAAEGQIAVSSHRARSTDNSGTQETKVLLTSRKFRNIGNIVRGRSHGAWLLWQRKNAEAKHLLSRLIDDDRLRTVPSLGRVNRGVNGLTVLEPPHKLRGSRPLSRLGPD